MAAGFYKLKIPQGGTFSKTLLLGSGPIFKAPAFADAGGGQVKVSVPGHIFTDGQKVKIVAWHKGRNISYTGSFTVADAIAGESFTFPGTWQGSISGTVQAARDLTGLDIRAQGRADYDDAAVAVDLVATIVVPTGGVASLYFGADVSKDLGPTKSAVWGCEIFDPNDLTFVDPILEGPLEISPEVPK